MFSVFTFFIFLNGYLNTLSKHRLKAGFLRESNNQLSKSGIKEKNEGLKFEEITPFDSGIKIIHPIQEANTYIYNLISIKNLINYSSIKL